MNSFSAFIAKGEALAKQVVSQATVMAEKAKQEEWVTKVATSMTDVCIFCVCLKFYCI